MEWLGWSSTLILELNNDWVKLVLLLESFIEGLYFSAVFLIYGVMVPARKGNLSLIVNSGVSQFESGVLSCFLNLPNWLANPFKTVVVLFFGTGCRFFTDESINEILGCFSRG